MLAFKDNTKLIYLHLNNNILKPDYCYGFPYLQHLIYLNLSFNYLNYISKFTFYRLKNLKVLLLNNNCIEYIDKDSFVNCESIDLIFLHSNKLYNIKSSSFKFEKLNNQCVITLFFNNLKTRMVDKSLRNNEKLKLVLDNEEIKEYIKSDNFRRLNKFLDRQQFADFYIK